VQTPQGIFPVKFFFSAGYNSSEGKEISNQAVIEEIRSIIDDEDPAAPLSDDAIARLLKKKGINVARRTIAKYRDILKIPSSSVRKIRR
jgi:RNA polymerase sigma-54 factor